MPRSAPVDGFRLSYDRAGSGPPVIALHGWPGPGHFVAVEVPVEAPEAFAAAVLERCR